MGHRLWSKLGWVAFALTDMSVPRHDNSMLFPPTATFFVPSALRPLFEVFHEL
jgi:hypothetical protein